MTRDVTAVVTSLRTAVCCLFGTLDYLRNNLNFDSRGKQQIFDYLKCKILFHEL